MVRCAAASLAVLAVVTAPLVLASLAPGAATARTAPTTGQSAVLPSAALPLAGKVVALDPGHQLGNSRYPSRINKLVWVGIWKPCNTTGTATNGGFPEATFTWRVTRRLASRLEDLGATVRLTRTTNSYDDWGPCVDARGRFGGRVGADLEVSVHGDGAASSTHGFFVIRPGVRDGYTDDIAGPSKRLALAVRRGLVGAGFGVSTAYGADGLDTRRDLGTLNMADVPTVMVELGNMRNAGDARCMTSSACRDRYARGLAEGITAYLG